MKNKLKLMATLISAVVCIPLVAQAEQLIDTKNLDKQINNKNTGTITIKACAPYPICKAGTQGADTKPTKDKPKKKSS